MIPMYRLWLHGLYGLYRPRCPLSPKRLWNLITPLSIQICKCILCGSHRICSPTPWNPCCSMLSKLNSGHGVTQPISVPLFFEFSALLKYTLTMANQIHICQVLAQLSCGDTCQIWMWFSESNSYFSKIENYTYGEINEWSFSNPHPRSGTGIFWCLV